ncbi:MAG TPA: acylhydrolase [Bacteroidetes bacterium]|nr:acylhydrolase [Bacteroidota bacterium]
MKQRKELDQKIVFLGDSITQNWKEMSPSGFFNNKNYVNKGIGGETTLQILQRYSQDVLDLEPDTVVILAGINDIADNSSPAVLVEIMKNIKSMTEQALKKYINVILCSVLPANDFTWNPEIKPSELVVEINKLIQQYAHEKNLSYVDYYTQMVDDKKGLKSELGFDSVHPNSEGYAIMEKIIKQYL